eukprot:scaffold26478_cov121-Skeletonema_marinoi.AAC.3
MAKCKGMNERLGKKNEERKKDKQSLGLFLMRHMNRDFSVSQKLHTRLRGRNEAMQGATHPGQTFQGR